MIPGVALLLLTPFIVGESTKVLLSSFSQSPHDGWFSTIDEKKQKPTWTVSDLHTTFKQVLLWLRLMLLNTRSRRVG